MTTVTRLFVKDDLATGQLIALSDAQAHQLRNVLRLETGAAVALFNGRDGEWAASVTIEKRRAVAEIQMQLKHQDAPSDIWLCFAPIKHERMGFLVEKATELGAGRLQPVITARTQGSRVNTDRLAEAAREAAEQCGRLTVPVVEAPLSLDALLKAWPADRRLFLCAEAGDALPATEAFAVWHHPAALLIGPEGGFSLQEFEILRAHSSVVPVSLGALTLRAETAVLAALALWSARLCSSR